MRSISFRPLSSVPKDFAKGWRSEAAWDRAHKTFLPFAKAFGVENRSLWGCDLALLQASVLCTKSFYKRMVAFWDAISHFFRHIEVHQCSKIGSGSLDESAKLSKARSSRSASALTTFAAPGAKKPCYYTNPSAERLKRRQLAWRERRSGQLVLELWIFERWVIGNRVRRSRWANIAGPVPVRSRVYGGNWQEECCSVSVVSLKGDICNFGTLLLSIFFWGGGAISLNCH